MRTQPDEFEARFVGLAIDEDQVRLDVAIAVIALFAAESVIEISPGQRLVLRQQDNGFE